MVVRAAGAFFVASNGPSEGAVFVIEGIHVEKSRLLGSFDQIVVYKWRDADHDEVASETEFVPVQVFVDSPAAAFLQGLVFPGIVQPVPEGSIQVDGAGAERTIRLRHAGAIVDLQVRSLAEEGSSPLRLQFVNDVTGWSFTAHGAEYPARATGFAYVPGLLLGETPAEPGNIRGFESSGFFVPEAVISLSSSNA